MAYLVMPLLSGKADNGHASHSGLTKCSLPQLNKGVAAGGQDLSLSLAIDEEKATGDHGGFLPTPKLKPRLFLDSTVEVTEPKKKRDVG